MKRFIELHNEGNKAFFPVANTGFAVGKEGRVAIFNGEHYCVDETMDEIAAKIEEATEQNPEPRQNIYYQRGATEPCEEDADRCGNVLFSMDGTHWVLKSYLFAPGYRFWAPCPKVEVRE